MDIEVVGDTLCALVTAGALASIGHQVSLVLPDGIISEKLFKQEEPYVESGLKALLDQQLAEKRLHLDAFGATSNTSVEVVFLALEPHQFSLA